MCAVLLGTTKRFLCKPVPPPHDVNTVIGNNQLGHFLNDYPEYITYTDEWVLQESRQCLPLLCFDESLVSTTFDHHAGNDAIWCTMSNCTSSWISVLTKVKQRCCNESFLEWAVRVLRDRLLGAMACLDNKRRLPLLCRRLKQQQLLVASFHNNSSRLPLQLHRNQVVSSNNNTLLH